MTEIWPRFQAFEECYEFMLAYAAQELPSHEGSTIGRQVGDMLQYAVTARGGLKEMNRGQRDALLEFLAILDRDARDALCCH